MDITWVPDHMGVEGNGNADEVAKEAVERKGVRRCPERFTSLAHVRHTISKRKWKEEKQWFRMENDRRPTIKRAPYHPPLESQSPDWASMKETVYVFEKILLAEVRTYGHRCIDSPYRKERDRPVVGLHHMSLNELISRLV